MKRVIENLTGDAEPFFCPADFSEGVPYKGHAHVFPVSALTIEEEVDLDK